MIENQLIETLEIHNRINLYLLDSISSEALRSLGSSKGRNVAQQFAHIHNVRLMWLNQAAPELVVELIKIPKEKFPDKQTLHSSIENSGLAIKRLLAKAMQSGGKVKGFKPHVVAFLGYLISHESHHRGQIVLSLKQSGYPVDKKVQFGLWEWGVR
jgi:uncharacterized damage-inducible protein DinB